MNTIAIILFVLLLAPIAGCFLAGVDRKLTAYLQHRVGPPLLQPFYDFLKLMNKENVVVSSFQNIYIVIYFIFVVASLVMLCLQMDLLMILFVYTTANIALIAGAISTGSPYSKIGSQREIMAMLAYEPVLIFYIIAIYMLTGSFKISAIPMTAHPLLLYLPLLFISMIFILCVKFKKSPFDFSTSHHAHQELVKGIFTEYSGPALGLVELTHWYEYMFLSGLIFLFWKQNILLGILISFITFLIIIVIDNITARLTWQWLFKVTWTIIVALCLINILYIYFAQIKMV